MIADTIDRKVDLQQLYGASRDDKARG